MKQAFQIIRSIVTHRWFVPFLAVSSTLVRVALVLHMHGVEHFRDETEYDKIAVAVWHGHGFLLDGRLTATRPPGQPLFLDMFLGFGARHVIVAEIAEAVMLAIVPFLCSRIGLALGMGLMAANIGAALAAFHPALAYASTTIYPTVLTACALTLGVWFCWLALQRRSAGFAISAGLALGIAGAATTTFGPVALLAAMMIALKRRFQIAVLIALVGTAPMIAWAVRNDLALGKFTVATNDGYNLLLGANDEATPRSGNWVQLPPVSQPIREIPDDEVQRKQAVAWIHAHPVRYAELAVERGIIVVDSVGKPKTQGLHDSLAARLIAWSLLPLVLLGYLGLVLFWKHPLAWFTLAALALVIVSSALTIAKPRFRFPCDPLLFVFAAGAVEKVKDRAWPAANTTHVQLPR